MRLSKIIFLSLFSVAMISCEEHNEVNLCYVNEDCPVCSGDGVISVDRYFGLYTKYNNCLLCSALSEEQLSQELPYSRLGEITFRGRGTVVISTEYGGHSCGCGRYAHYRGQVKCVNCEENGCGANKFAHHKY